MKRLLGAALLCGLVSPFATQAVADDRGVVFGIVGALTQQAIQQADQPRMEEPPQRVFRVQDEEAERLAFRQEIQRRLNLLGFDAGYPDGRFGGKTRNAIASFQESIGRPVTGKITESEVAALYDQTNDGLHKTVARPAPVAPAVSADMPSVERDGRSEDRVVMQLAPAVAASDTKFTRVSTKSADQAETSSGASLSQTPAGEGATLSLEPVAPLPTK
ncbi:peptidoglycan-binding domain-containing protein [Rhizobium chutanense]|uniref:Peptidoglycan-binding protein n=1 Tax=Rhizobium chutanense TaxID=2035448 RepID=A0A3S0S239_9HYPH|nr:peptidoglycan-binding domain-containing protein [Rhizobium chutanense]RUM06401.1 peptidoglycan-binding protein [Rhizobium chutanense]